MARADRGQFGDQAFWIGQCHIHPFVKGDAIRVTMGHGMTQDRSLSQKVIHLTRHGGFKADNFLGTDMSPLGMRSGQANDALERGMRG